MRRTRVADGLSVVARMASIQGACDPCRTHIRWQLDQCPRRPMDAGLRRPLGLQGRHTLRRRQHRKDVFQHHRALLGGVVDNRPRDLLLPGAWRGPLARGEPGLLAPGGDFVGRLLRFRLIGGGLLRASADVNGTASRRRAYQRAVRADAVDRRAFLVAVKHGHDNAEFNENHEAGLGHEHGQLLCAAGVLRAAVQSAPRWDGLPRRGLGPIPRRHDVLARHRRAGALHGLAGLRLETEPGVRASDEAWGAQGLLGRLGAQRAHRVVGVVGLRGVGIVRWVDAEREAKPCGAWNHVQPHRPGVHGVGRNLQRPLRLDRQQARRRAQ
mmetsp:Transcript_41562/g.120417  ORF Transcript_41562/g.120417 Transcript_41562/m.120417 type:complete len:326 (+) Transcript_41562:122-1099(+)